MNGPGNGDDLPDPEIEKIRNFSDLPSSIRGRVTDGALLTIDGAAVHENAIDVNILSGVLVHFDRLFRILQAARSGLEVKRAGRIADVVGSRHLSALPALSGSYAMPLRLEAPEGELVGDDREALEHVMALLSGDDSHDLGDVLSHLPERVGDELYALLHELASGQADLKVEAVRDGQATDEVSVSVDAAKSRATWLTSLVESAVAGETIQGKLFRIDTKRGRIALDSQEADESVIVEASFQPSQLEDLRRALNHVVEIEVQVIEEKRPYERTARNRVMSVTGIRELEDNEGQVEVTPASEIAAEEPAPESEEA